VGAGLLARDLATQILGPTANVLGQDFAKGYTWTTQNIIQVLKVARGKLGESLNLDGNVHPRIARKIFREAADVDDCFAAEYFGGLLASSRDPHAADDSAVPFLKKLEQLSSEQIKLHFVSHYLYVKAVFYLQEREQHSFASDYGLRIDLASLQKLFPHRELEWWLPSVISQMQEAGVLGENHTLRSFRHISGRNQERHKKEGLYLTFSNAGLCLFMRALGLRGTDPAALPSMEIDASISDELLPELKLDLNTELFRSRYVDPAHEAMSTAGDTLDEQQSKISDLENEVESLQEKLEELIDTVNSGRDQESSDA
jgi:hypothetical protein